tara:strand:+ start:688 stop:864 length:177 start_codon:yes stop_codon:yes gene_type:complete
MNVGTLVKVVTTAYRQGQVGVIVKVHPPFLPKLVPTYSVLFWDEKIDEIAGACIEEIL